MATSDILRPLRIFGISLAVAFFGECGRIAWFSHFKRIIIRNEASGALTEISVSPLDGKSSVLDGEGIPSGESRTFYVSTADRQPSHAVRFRTGRLRLFEQQFGPYSNGPTGHPW